VLFEQVLFNLLDNAAKYAPDDTDHPRSGRRDEDSVAAGPDEGAGIPPAILSRSSINSTGPTRAIT
jgi:two-component system sensor histidine kinase KdpD